MDKEPAGLLLALAISLFCLGCTAAGTDPPKNGGIAPAETAQAYVVFAWNDLGMHCLNPSYDTAVILPPYNTVNAQVLKRGDPPELVTSGVTVSYALVDNSYSVGKGQFGQFWTYMMSLFGKSQADNIGLAGKGLSGTMDWVGADGVYRAVGIPVVPRTDSAPLVRAPYQQAVITVRDGAGQVIASTKATVPTSDEINCAKCHAPGASIQASFQDILDKHDALSSTNLAAAKPVLCASCHSSPALGTPLQAGIPYLSASIHGFHATRGASCLDCHPGATTLCNRSLAHTSSDGNCTSCHESMQVVASSIAAGRVPWQTEPACGSCHLSPTQATLTRIPSPGLSSIPEVNTGAALDRTSKGHGGLSCTACHSSPHAMVPSREAKDNFQALAYQGKAVTIGSCGACHPSSQGRGAAEFMDTHGGPNPEEFSACAVCHTAVPSADIQLWPHGFAWKPR
ncbi:MAG TPA: hypothetical protein VFL04_09060 [Rectinemataceae bacterium]|nr:hypothetical protein [Rectinemataceae bacterium]